MKQNFIFNKKSFTIKSAEECDASLLLYWWNDSEIMAHAGCPFGLNTTIDKVKESIAKNNENRQLLIIYCEVKPIGELNYTNTKGEFDISIKICNKLFQNSSYGTEILKHFFKFLFKEKMQIK